MADRKATISITHTDPINAESSLETNLEDGAHNWKKYTPDKLQMPISAPLRLINIESEQNMPSENYKVCFLCRSATLLIALICKLHNKKSYKNHKWKVKSPMIIIILSGNNYL